MLDARRALEHDGVQHPERNVVVVLGRDIFGEQYGTVLARKRAVHRQRSSRASATLADERGEGIAFAPGGPYVGRVGAARPKRKDWHDVLLEDYRLNVCPPTDNRPFFFNMTRLGEPRPAPSQGYIYSARIPSRSCW